MLPLANPNLNFSNAKNWGPEEHAKSAEQFSQASAGEDHSISITEVKTVDIDAKSALTLPPNNANTTF